MSGWHELLGRAEERAKAPPLPPLWGYRVALEVGDSFCGRCRGEDADPKNFDKQGQPRRIHLFWDTDDQRCFSRSYAALDRELDNASPKVGDRIAVVRCEDYPSAGGAGYSFGVAVEPCDEPIPADDLDDEPADDLEGDDGIPF